MPAIQNSSEVMKIRQISQLPAPKMPTTFPSTYSKVLEEVGYNSKEGADYFPNMTVFAYEQKNTAKFKVLFDKEEKDDKRCFLLPLNGKPEAWIEKIWELLEKTEQLSQSVSTF